MTEKPADQRVDLIDAAVELMGRTGRNGTLRVQGSSMLPNLAAGQTLLAEFSSAGLRRGDLMLYRQQDYLVVHRLVHPGRASGDSRPLTTRGDGRLDLDPPVAADSVLGRVIAIEDTGGWWNLQGRRARLYAWNMAWHALFWSTAGRLCTRADRGFAKLGLRTPFRGIAWRIDRVSLNLAHRLLFRLTHRRMELPKPPPAPVVSCGDARVAPRGREG